LKSVCCSLVRAGFPSRRFTAGVLVGAVGASLILSPGPMAPRSPSVPTAWECVQGVACPRVSCPEMACPRYHHSSFEAAPLHPGSNASGPTPTAETQGGHCPACPAPLGTGRCSCPRICPYIGYPSLRGTPFDLPPPLPGALHQPPERPSMFRPWVRETFQPAQEQLESLLDYKRCRVDQRAKFEWWDREFASLRQATQDVLFPESRGKAGAGLTGISLLLGLWRLRAAADPAPAPSR